MKKILFFVLMFMSISTMAASDSGRWLCQPVEDCTFISPSADEAMAAEFIDRNAGVGAKIVPGSTFTLCNTKPCGIFQRNVDVGVTAVSPSYFKDDKTAYRNGNPAGVKISTIGSGVNVIVSTTGHWETWDVFTTVNGQTVQTGSYDEWVYDSVTYSYSGCTSGSGVICGKDAQTNS